MHTKIKIKVKVSKATLLKAAGIALGLIGSLIESEERKIEIDNAVKSYFENNNVRRVRHIPMK